MTAYFQHRKTRKQLDALLHHARTLKASRGDLMNPAEHAHLDQHTHAALTARDSRDPAAMATAAEALDQCLTELSPPKPLAAWRENFDVLVVAISVAMAFRAYFYQPFKIPTGSMQPTLYGIHSQARDASEATLLDKQPFKFAKWLVTGQSFKIIRAQASGTANIFPSDSSKKPGYSPVVVAGKAYYVPNDAILANPPRLAGGITNGAHVKAGTVLWSGTVTSGDFVFVNRWKWNFSHPKLGDVMVFATTGIPKLIQGTHYIKRMTGRPGDTLQIAPPDLIVNGQIITEPERIGQIARREQIAPWAPPYAGFNPCGRNSAPASYSPAGTLCFPSDTVTLGPREYYAMGDNSFNSYDSRYWGPVPERNLLGPAAVVYWPLTSPRFGRIR